MIKYNNKILTLSKRGKLIKKTPFLSTPIHIDRCSKEDKSNIIAQKIEADFIPEHEKVISINIPFLPHKVDAKMSFTLYDDKYNIIYKEVFDIKNLNSVFFQINKKLNVNKEYHICLIYLKDKNRFPIRTINNTNIKIDGKRISCKGLYFDINYDYKFDVSIYNKKIALYTAITGGYDNLIIPKEIPTNIDLFLFTDTPNKFKKYKKIFNIEKIKDIKINNVKTARWHKLMGNKLFPEYDYNIWVDANIEILCDLNYFINNHVNEQNKVFIFNHSLRNCIYKEAEACIVLHKAQKEDIVNQIEKYKKDGMPKNYGLAETGVIIRKPDLEAQDIIDKWWIEIEKNTHRDQLSFNYVIWKNGADVFCSLKRKCFDKYFIISQHPNKKIYF